MAVVPAKERRRHLTARKSGSHRRIGADKGHVSRAKRNGKKVIKDKHETFFFLDDPEILDFFRDIFFVARFWSAAWWNSRQPFSPHPLLTERDQGRVPFRSSINDKEHHLCQRRSYPPPVRWGVDQRGGSGGAIFCVGGSISCVAHVDPPPFVGVRFERSDRREVISGMVVHLVRAWAAVNRRQAIEHATNAWNGTAGLCSPALWTGTRTSLCRCL